MFCGPLRLTLNASIGGSISAFEWLEGDAARPILRKCNSAGENVLDAASFPLVPYVNRIRGGAFTFRGREVRLTPNMPGDPSPLHGQGWLNPWKVEESGDRYAVLSFRHAAGEWPWDYEARQEFALDERGLSASIECRNTSGGPMPCGLGFHPYFPCGADTRIQTEVDEVWTVDKDVLPAARMPAEDRYAIGDDPVCARGLDNGFGGWSGRTILSDVNWPYQIELSSPQARYFQLYSPENGGIFVAEPVTHANAALNEPEEDWARLGIRILEPGEEMALDARIAVEPRGSLG